MRNHKSIRDVRAATTDRVADVLAIALVELASGRRQGPRMARQRAPLGCYRRLMSKAAHEVFADALALSEEDRGRLAERLVESLNAPTELGAEEAWSDEIQRRLARFEAGQATSIPMSEAIARMHRAARER